MQTIHVQPRLSETDFFNLVNRVEHFNTPFIDGKVLSAIIKATFYCGLKKTEILSLNISDIVDKNGVIRQNIYNEIPISDQSRTIFQDHLEYLKFKSYRRINSAPLFPNRKKERYCSRQLQYHLKKCMKDVGLETIRQSGICRFYEQMKAERRYDVECLQKTVQFARCTQRHVLGILKNKITPAGKKTQMFLVYWEIIECTNPENTPTYKNVPIDEAYIQNDPKLSKKEKELLIRILHNDPFINNP